jgi:hypothetical protein
MGECHPWAMLVDSKLNKVSDLWALSLVSKAFYSLCSPLLYRQVSVNIRNLTEWHTFKRSLAAGAGPNFARYTRSLGIWSFDSSSFAVPDTASKEVDPRVSYTDAQQALFEVLKSFKGARLTTFR